MKVVVVGGGVIGVSSAHELLKAGYDVTLLEANTAVGQETSFANGGLLTPSMSDPWNSPGVWKDLLRYIGKPDAPMLLRLKAMPSLALWGLQFLRYSEETRFHKALRANTELSLVSMKVMNGLLEQEKLSFDYNSKGVLKIYRSAHALEQGINKMQRVTDLGVDRQVLSREDLLAKEPALDAIGEQLAGALYFPHDASGDAMAFTQGLASRVCEKGGQIILGEKVHKLCVQNQQVHAVETSTGMVEADVIVVAAGSWTNTLLAPFWRGLPVRPVKGYSLTLSGENTNKALMPKMPIVDDDLHAAITPLGGKIRVAGTAEFTGFDDTLTKGRLTNLQHLLKAVYPEIAEELLSRPYKEWCGFRPVSADGMPFIGKTPVQGLYLNTGHGPFGWTMAMGSARILSQVVSGKTADMNSDIISPLRYWRR